MKRYSRGLTLLELMTAVTVLGILSAIAIPSFRDFTANSRTTAATNDFVTALNLARSEALRRATPTIVCPSSDQASCTLSNRWDDGWIAFVDPNGNGTVDAGELLQSWPAPGGGIVANGTQNRVVYNAMGMGQLPAVTVRIGLAACTGTRVGRTVVSVVGTVQTSKVACPP